jgi:hypothetical protein
MLRSYGGTMEGMKISIYGLCALAIIAIAVIVRIALVALGWPQLDSDEGTIGIMAMHILNRGEWPVFFYRQGYMGALEAYVAAFFFHLFGTSTFMLRFGLIIFFALFLLCMYLLCSMLFTKIWALITIALLSFGSAPMLTRQLVAIGGYAETLLFGVFLIVLSLWLAFTFNPQKPRQKSWSRFLLYALWGLVAGAAIWSDELVAPFLLTAGLIILVFCWRELLGFPLLFLIVGLLVGSAPLILYNISAAPGDDTFTWLQKLQTAKDTVLPPFQILFPRQLEGALLISMPGATGAYPLCYNYVDEIQIWNIGGLHAIRCTLMHTIWSASIILLWIIALCLTIRNLWRITRKTSRPWPDEQRKEFIRHAGRFALLFNGFVVLFIFVISPNAALYPVPDMRYLECLLLTTPALLWPLWEGLGAVKPLALRFAKMTVAVQLASISFFMRRGLLILISALLLLGTVSTFDGSPFSPLPRMRYDKFDIIGVYQYQGVPQTRDYNRQEALLIRNLLHLHMTRIYSDYWTCDRIVFRSNESITCGVQRSLLDNGQEVLRMGHNRYLPYYYKVSHDPHSVYVFQVGSPEARYMDRYVRNQRHMYRFFIAGYFVYQPPH